MSFVKTFDVLMMSLETFLTNSETDYSITEYKLNALQKDCEIIDHLVEESEGKSTEVSIDEENASILISCVFEYLEVGHDMKLLTQLFSDASSVSVFSPDRQGELLQIEFRFANQMDRE